MKRAIALLAAAPNARYAIATDTAVEVDSIVIGLAIRGLAALELEVDRQRYDGVKLIEIVERLDPLIQQERDLPSH